MQAAISQCLTAIIGMQAALFVSGSERDAVLHPFKTVIIAITLATNMLLLIVDSFILFFQYKAYLTLIMLLIIDKVIEWITIQTIKRNCKKAGRVIYLDNVSQEQIQLDRKNLIAPMIIKRYEEEKKVKKTENEE